MKVPWLTAGGSFEVWPRWLTTPGTTRFTFTPDLRYRRDRIGD